ncbi:unnamed protein product [Mortierella alpina]
MKQFLKSESMHILLNFAEHTAKYAAHVQETLSFRPTPCLPSTPSQGFQKPFVVLTPHKHNKRKNTEEADEEQDEQE